MSTPFASSKSRPTLDVRWAEVTKGLVHVLGTDLNHFDRTQSRDIGIKKQLPFDIALGSRLPSCVYAKNCDS